MTPKKVMVHYRINCSKSSDLENFGWNVQNITCRAFFLLSFCWKIPISYPNSNIPRNKDLWNSLSSYMLKSKVNLRNLYFSIFLNSDTKLVFFNTNWVGTMPLKWYFGQSNQNLWNSSKIQYFSSCYLWWFYKKLW